MSGPGQPGTGQEAQLHAPGLGGKHIRAEPSCLLLHRDRRGKLSSCPPSHPGHSSAVLLQPPFCQQPPRPQAFGGSSTPLPAWKPLFLSRLNLPGRRRLTHFHADKDGLISPWFNFPECSLLVFSFKLCSSQNAANSCLSTRRDAQDPCLCFESEMIKL